MFERRIAPEAQPFSALWGIGPTADFAGWDADDGIVGAVDASGDTARGGHSVSDWDAGFADGWAAAMEQNAAHNVAQHDAQQKLIATLEKFAPMPADTLVDALRAHMLALLADIAGSAPVDETHLIDGCRAMAAIAHDQGTATLSLHPDDLAFVDGQLHGVVLVADDRLPRGDVRLNAGAMTVEHGPDAALRALGAAWAADQHDPQDTPC